MHPYHQICAALAFLLVLAGCRPADTPSESSGPSAVKEVTSAQQFDQVLAEEEVVMVDFWASWCYPCQVLKPTIAEISNDYDQVTILSVDVDEFGGLAQRFNVSSIPAVHIFKGGEQVDVLIGAMPRESYTEILDKLVAGMPAAIPEPSEEPVAEAEPIAEGG